VFLVVIIITFLVVIIITFLVVIIVIDGVSDG